MLNADVILEKVIKNRNNLEKVTEEEKYEMTYYLEKVNDLTKKKEVLDKQNKEKAGISHILSAIFGLAIVYFIFSRINVDITNMYSLGSYVLVLPVVLVGTLEIVKLLSEKIIELKYTCDDTVLKNKEDIEKELMIAKIKISELEKKLGKDAKILDLLSFIEDNVKYYSKQEEKQIDFVKDNNKSLTRKLEK